MMKRSPIWDHFKICEDEKYASCNYCNRDISRGGESEDLQHHKHSQPS